MALLLPRDTQRLTFRAWEEEDLQLAGELWGNPEVTKHISRTAWAPEQVQERLAQELESRRISGLQYWPLFLKSGEAYVGCCGLRPSERAQPANVERLPELGFHLLPGFWGQGLATEAARATIALAFETLGATALFAGHHPQNEGSRRVLDKLGFRKTGTALYPPTGVEHFSYRLERRESRRRLPGETAPLPGLVPIKKP
jgi:RimJ/RimL family protein N-acetyltransferase